MGNPPPAILPRMDDHNHEEILSPLIDSVVRRPGDMHTLHRSGVLTPYTAEVIAEDALHAGRGAQLELTVTSHADPDEVARVRRQFAWLGARGVRVQVRQGPGSRAGARRGGESTIAPVSRAR